MSLNSFPHHLLPPIHRPKFMSVVQMVGGWTRRRKSGCFPFPATAWMGRQPYAASFSFQHSRLQSEVQRGTPMLKSRHFVFHGHWKPPLPLGGWADGPQALAADRPLAAPLWFLSLLWPAFENVWSLYGDGEVGGVGRGLWPFVSQTPVFSVVLMGGPLGPLGPKREQGP